MTTPNNRRIQRDIHDLLRVKDEMGIPFAFRADELSHIRVNYLPTEGRYAGQPVHVHIDVPFDYPTQPLAVSIHTPGFTHPNVYSFGICLDMLKPPEHYAAPYTGWSAAYSLSSVIMQMYGFLMVDDQVEQMYGDAPRKHDHRDYVRLPSTVQCACGFTELPVALDAASTLVASSSATAVSELPNDIIDQIMGLTDGTTLAKLTMIDSANPLVQSAREAKQRAETKCYFSKDSPFEDLQVVLGMGVRVSRRPQRQGVEKVELSIASMDLLSSSAFNGTGVHAAGVRLSPWNIPFDAFLPVIINADHAERALNALSRYLPTMMVTGENPNDPVALMDVIARLFNGLVVELMRAHTNGDRVARHMSDAALATFCHLHHLLVTVVVRRHPNIANDCTRAVLRFVQEPASRHKKVCPDLGLLLVKYMLVPMDCVRWSDFASAFLREALVRHVMWIKTDGFTAPTRTERDDTRLRDHLDGSLISLRLVCLMAFFANALVRPSSEATKARELQNIETAYNSRNGDPPPRISELFYGHARSVMTISSWTHVMSLLRLRLNAPGAADPAAKTRVFANVLRQAVVDSCDSGYHRAPRGWVRSVFHSWNPSPLVSV